MTDEPAGSAEVVIVAVCTPAMFESVPVPMTVVPIRNSTEPVGTGVTITLGVIFAVSVTLCPSVDGLSDVKTVAVVATDEIVTVLGEDVEGFWPVEPRNAA